MRTRRPTGSATRWAILESDTRYDEIETDAVAGDLGELGDASSGASYVFDYGQGPVEGVVVYLAVGDVGAALFIESVPGVGAAALGEIAAAQVDCLEDGACPDPIDAPEKGAAADDEADARTPHRPPMVTDEADAEDDAGGRCADEEDVTPESDEADEDEEDVTPEADDDEEGHRRPMMPRR